MANGYIPSGARGGFPVQVRTISTMGDLGLTRLPAPGRPALELGYACARGVADNNPAAMRDHPPSNVGSPGYQRGQTQILVGTDFRNFARSSRAQTGRVR